MKKLVYIVLLVFMMIIITVGQENRACADLNRDKYNCSCQNFPGLYYDLDQDICTEIIGLRLSDIAPDKSQAILSGSLDEYGFRGISYITQAKEKKFEFDSWGKFEVIGFIGEKCFVAYEIPDTEESDFSLYKESDDKNMLANYEISKILMDSDQEITVASNAPLMLGEGYELKIKSIDIDGNKVSLELSKDGSVVDSKFISPSKDGATMKDKTYYYKRDIGDSKDVVIVAVHFKNAFRGRDQDLATVDGVWQISDNPIKVEPGIQYDKMTLEDVDPNSISIFMSNKDYPIELKKNKRDVVLMNNIHLKTADQDDISINNPLRYCMFVI